MKQLILGGARSGKSKTAEQRASASRKKLVYIATGQAGDDEMAQRIEAHKKNRGDSWALVEEPLYLAQALKSHCSDGTAVVVDCLTLWISNCLGNNSLDEEKTQLLEVLPGLKGDVIFVSNEVGSGIVPLGELSREFVDQSGWLNQQLGKICERVTLVVAGLPMELKN